MTYITIDAADLYAVRIQSTPILTGRTFLDVLPAVLSSDINQPRENTVNPAESDTVRRDVLASKNGDADAYARVIKRYQPAVTKRMWKFTRDPNDLEELVHEVFVDAYFSLNRYRERGAFSAWLNRIATRTGYRYWKRRNRNRETPVHDTTLDRSRINDETTAGTRPHDELRDLLSRLKPRDRLVLTLLYWEDYSIPEIAQQTGWTKTMVKVQAHRARKRLRKLLEQT